MKKIFALALLTATFPICLIAQSHYLGQHQGKFLLKDKLTPKVAAFDLQNVRLLEGRFKDNMEREQQWLLSLESKSLLQSFKNNAGVFNGREGGYFVTKKYGGWESLDCDLRGHSLGHILSGLALMHASTGNQEFKLKADSLVSGLAQVQNALNQGGYLSAYPQELINRNIRGESVWAPWYTLHKIFAGLLDQYLYSDNQQALEIAIKFSDWAYHKLSPLTSVQRKLMLRNEFGGINEPFYNLYAITGNKNDKWLAEYFYHDDALDPLKEKQDILDKKHANTYIPKLLGLTRNYELTADKTNSDISNFFWNTVVDHHTFATGSNSDKEKFFEPDQLSKHLTGYTGESCNVYNMLKLTKHLYTHSGELKYVNYYEKALFNHILGQQDPQSGMISYFLPMLPGAHKVYSTPEHSFWCCVGTGFENQAKFGESIYYHTAKELFVNQFIASEVAWKEGELKLKQETEFPKNGEVKLTVLEAGSKPSVIKLRYPYWAKTAKIKVNGKSVKINQKADSYLVFNRNWKKGDVIEANFGMELSVIPTNDNENKIALAYGPIVLAGLMGNEGFIGTTPFSDTSKYNDYYTFDYNIPANIKTSFSIDKKNLAKDILLVSPQKLTFKSAKNNITLRPLYDIHRERYVVYWDLVK
jgi:DUF1680 family protein